MVHYCYHVTIHSALVRNIYNPLIKAQALKLRTKGYSYSEITAKLGLPIPKNTLTGWFKNISLSEEAKLRITHRIRKGGAPGRAIAWQRNHEKRLLLLRTTYEKVTSEAKIIDKPTAKLCLAMLYIAEGGKVGEYIRFGNSDSRIIEVFLCLLRYSYKIDEQKLRARIQCRADQDLYLLQEYWSRIANISASQFSKPLIDKRTIGIPTLKPSYKGVLVVEYYSNTLFLELRYIFDILYSQLKKGPVVYR